MSALDIVIIALVVIAAAAGAIAFFRRPSCGGSKGCKNAGNCENTVKSRHKCDKCDII